MKLNEIIKKEVEDFISSLHNNGEPTPIAKALAISKSHLCNGKIKVVDVLNDDKANAVVVLLMSEDDEQSVSKTIVNVIKTNVLEFIRQEFKIKKIYIATI
ncbi:MAG: hypothetical protein WHV28_09655 [Bacteroidota bacterium]